MKVLQAYYTRQIFRQLKEIQDFFSQACRQSQKNRCQDWEKTISGKDISTNFQGLPSYHEKQFVVLPSWHVSCKSLVGLGTCLVGKSAVIICRLVGSNELQQFCRFFILRSPICRWKNSLPVGIYFLWKKQHIDCFKWLMKSYAFYCYVWYLGQRSLTWIECLTCLQFSFHDEKFARWHP